MSHEGPKKLSPHAQASQSVQASVQSSGRSPERSPERPGSPGKRTQSMRLPRSSGAPVQQKRAAAAASGAQVALTEQWLDTAMRPDIFSPPESPPEPVQRKGASQDAGPAAPGGGSGRAMPEDARATMEQSFGADFSAVRIHEGPQAASLGALAYTQGTDIHFAPGQYEPQGQRGQELLGHELAHVVQQSQGRVHAPGQGQGKAQGAPINDDAALEQEADDMGARAARGERVSGASSGSAADAGAIQRKDAPIQAKVVTVLNFHRLADQIHEAIDGLGTDEEAVYSALAALEHKKENIEELAKVYQSKFGTTLEADIEDDFSGSELAHARSLLQVKADEKAAGAGAKGPDYGKLAEQVHGAISGMGTDEEAVYSALSRLDRDAAKIKQLEDAYQSKYGISLRSDIMDDFSGDELKHVLELLGDRSNGERVDVASDEEAKKAAEIIQQIYAEYGIDVNSQAGVDAIYKDYGDVPTSVRDMLKTKAWEYKELVALKKALDHFAPILGEKRKGSTRGGDGQEIITVSKVDQAIDENTSAGVLDTTTLGEYFESSQNFSMFTAGTNSTVDFADNGKQLEGTAIHEIAHGLMEYCLDDYVSELAYWDSKYKQSGEAGAEAPITDYGDTNAGEDLSEAVMYYFVDPATLKSGQSGKSKGQIGNPCPERFAFIEKAVKAWKKDTE